MTIRDSIDIRETARQIQEAWQRIDSATGQEETRQALKDLHRIMHDLTEDELSIIGYIALSATHHLSVAQEDTP